MLGHIEQQARDLQAQQTLIQRKDRDIAWRDAKIEKITFELAHLKRWRCWVDRTDIRDHCARLSTILNGIT